MALYSVAAGVWPPGEVQYFLLAIASIISFVVIDSFDPPRPFAPGPSHLNWPWDLAVFFPLGFSPPFGALVFFFPNMFLPRGGVFRGPPGGAPPPPPAPADPTANRTGQLP